MSIDTTYVMCDDVIERLADAEERTKQPKEELLVLAMRMMMNDLYILILIRLNMNHS